MEGQQKTCVGLFNYAHTYALSAVELEKLEVDATHWNAPVYFLYFHAVELFLKAFLVGNGHDLEDLRKEHGHKVRPMVEIATGYGLDLTATDEEAITMMAETDNVITARYLRVGTHQRLPFSVYDELCQRLYVQVEPIAYAGASGPRRPIRWW